MDSVTRHGWLTVKITNEIDLKNEGNIEVNYTVLIERDLLRLFNYSPTLLINKSETIKWKHVKFCI